VSRVAQQRLSPATGTSSYRDDSGDWREQAACLNHDPETWFPIGHVTKDDQAQAAYAKSICRRCPVRTQCLRDAVDKREPYGIWGGLDENERHGLHRSTARNSIGDICGGGGGRTAHRRAGTPVCPACLTYENRMRVEADLRRWDAAAPLIASGLTHAEAGAQLGVTEESVRRAYNAAQRQATQAA
jgi:WhiB family redox-sensing transcriptional regulator